MPRDTSTDTITDDLIQRYVLILSTLSGWGVLSDSSKAVYPHLGLPQPQEPFPAAYCYVANQTHDYLQGEGLRRDTYTVGIRMLGGPITPSYRVNAESAVYKMNTAVLNELTYRSFLQDPTPGMNNAAFDHIAPSQKVTVGPGGRVQSFGYSEQGAFIGIELPTTIMLEIHIGRVS